MAEFEYKEAKHLAELREVKNNTDVRDFIASIQAYHDILTPNAKQTLIAFIINSKIIGTAKTKFGDGQGIVTLDGLKSTLYERCGTKAFS
jgi:hypothetical protein